MYSRKNKLILISNLYFSSIFFASGYPPPPYPHCPSCTPPSFSNHFSFVVQTQPTMLKWVQSGLSAVAGTAEPEYGREAIHTVVDTINNGDCPVSRDTTIADFNWLHPDYTNVETQTFYFLDLTSGYTGFAQVIHSNLMD